MNVNEAGNRHWVEAWARREIMARWIGTKLCGHAARLVPFQDTMFHVPDDLSLDNMAGVWADQRVCDVVWWPVAHVLRQDRDMMLDHAWAFGWPDEPREPWGFVTEPYHTEGEARVAVARAALMTSGWGIGYHVLPPARSTWNPGECVVVIAYCRKGFAPVFIANAMRWLFAEEGTRDP